MKVNFVHHVSYELRSPLTTIIGFAHFLSDPSTGPLTLKQSEYLSYITSSTNALLAIINNILDLATIDAGAMSLSLGPVDVRKAIEQAAAGVQDRLATDNIHLDVEMSDATAPFVADERRVVQVLYNLLANAVGFSPQGGTVTLTADPARQPDDLLRHRPGPRHSAGKPGQGVRLVRSQRQRLAPSRRRTRSLAGPLVRRDAWRHRSRSIRSWAAARPSPASFPPSRRCAALPNDGLLVLHGRSRRRSGDRRPDGRSRPPDRRTRRHHALGRSRRRQDDRGASADSLSCGRRRARGAEPDLYARAGLRPFDARAACRPLSRQRRERTRRTRPRAVSRRHAGADRMARSRRQSAARRSDRYRLQPSRRSGDSRRARGDRDRARRGAGNRQAAVGLARLPRKIRRDAGDAQAHGGRCFDALLRTARVRMDARRS